MIQTKFLKIVQVNSLPNVTTSPYRSLGTRKMKVYIGDFGISLQVKRSYRVDSIPIFW